MFLKIVSEISKTQTRPSYRLQVIAVGRHAKTECTTMPASALSEK